MKLMLSDMVHTGSHAQPTRTMAANDDTLRHGKRYGNL
jgi:hypothetical protein